MATSRYRIVRQLPICGAAITAFAATALGVAGASPGSGSAAPVQGPPGPLVELNAYCRDHGGVGHVANGRTVYCVQVFQTDAFVWSYSPRPMAFDPNQRGYSCTDVCRWPDGSIVPNYQRCGVLCGEPPTSGDVQSGLNDCLESGVDFVECERRIGG
ncbi:hypothetical protein [Nocardia farcinica]